MASCKDCIHYNICCLWSTADLEESEAYKYCFGNFKAAADVVPKSEVDKLRTDFGKSVRRCEEIAISAIQKAKTEVAREIFEEADKIFMANCLSLETYKAWCELKKKYTEA